MPFLSVIRRWHLGQHIPIREIERRTGLLRNTISKYLRSGAAPLAEDFAGWQWSRNENGQVFYDGRRRDGSAKLLALQFGADGAVAPLAPPPEQALPATGWRIHRSTRANRGSTARVVKILEDTPFYARSEIEAQVDGVMSKTVHESLSMERFTAPWVQVMLPFRMPRL